MKQSKACYYCGRKFWKVKTAGQLRHRPICEDCLKYYLVDKHEEGGLAE